MRLTSLLIIICWAGSALAGGPFAPVTVVPAPEDKGDIFSPGVRFTADLVPAYVEEEFFISGQANLYTYAEIPVRGELVLLEPDLAYATRIIVRRPVDPDRFNGSVVIEWWNSSAGFDTAPTWDPSAEYFARKGIVYVGVTNSSTSIGHLVNGCLLLGILPPPLCGTRYEGLTIPENGVAFEMVSQIANLLRTDAPPNPLHPDYPVERIFHAGQSQQGGSMVTYASAFHFPANDGYFVQAAGSARPINFLPPCEEVGAPPYPECAPTLQGAQRRVRSDLLVPVYRAQTETDMSGVLGGNTRQTDSATFRYYETAGTAHATVHKDIELFPAGVIGPEPFFLEDACEFELNTLADGPILGSLLYNAMWENMERQARFGVPPPTGALIATDSNNEVARDAHENALGGIRLPQMDVPVATYGPRNVFNPDLPPFLAPIGTLFCRLSGTVMGFDAEKLAVLYPSEADFLRPLHHRATDLVAARFLLPADLPRVVQPVSSVDRKHRACIKAMSRKGASKSGVWGAQNQQNESCVQDAGADQLGGETTSECVTGFSQGDVAQASARLHGLEATHCLGPDRLPVFGYPGEGVPVAAEIAGAAREQSLGLLDDLFGSDLDGAIRSASDDPQGLACQTDVLARLNDLTAQMIDEGIRAGERGLRKGTALAPNSLAQAILGAIAAGENARVGRKLASLGRGIADRCAAPAVDLAAALPGACAGAANNAARLVSCLAEKARCRACLLFNAVNDLGAACDAFDDDVGDNLSCEPTLPP